jgi:DNA-binding TFAR19-related protein (PDSD5 family)
MIGIFTRRREQNQLQDSGMTETAKAKGLRQKVYRKGCIRQGLTHRAYRRLRVAELAYERPRDGQTVFLNLALLD